MQGEIVCSDTSFWGCLLTPFTGINLYYVPLPSLCVALGFWFMFIVFYYYHFGSHLANKGLMKSLVGVQLAMHAINSHIGPVHIGPCPDFKCPLPPNGGIGNILYTLVSPVNLVEQHFCKIRKSKGRWAARINTKI